MQIYWAHTYAYGDANGVAWCGMGTGGNGDAVIGGGYAKVPPPGSGGTPSIETDGSSAQGLYPFVGSFPAFDSNYNATNLNFGFAVPHGVQVEVHIWVATA
jgi:hypothetical protein